MPARPGVHRERAGQPLDRRLGGRVRQGAADRALGLVRRDVHDRARAVAVAAGGGRRPRSRPRPAPGWPSPGRAPGRVVGQVGVVEHRRVVHPAGQRRHATRPVRRPLGATAWSAALPTTAADPVGRVRRRPTTGPARSAPAPRRRRRRRAAARTTARPIPRPPPVTTYDDGTIRRRPRRTRLVDPTDARRHRLGRGVPVAVLLEEQLQPRVVGADSSSSWRPQTVIDDGRVLRGVRREDALVGQQLLERPHVVLGHARRCR